MGILRALGEKLRPGPFSLAYKSAKQHYNDMFKHYRNGRLEKGLESRTNFGLAHAQIAASRGLNVVHPRLSKRTVEAWQQKLLQAENGLENVRKIGCNISDAMEKLENEQISRDEREVLEDMLEISLGHLKAARVKL